MPTPSPTEHTQQRTMSESSILADDRINELDSKLDSYIKTYLCNSHDCPFLSFRHLKEWLR
jgi:hypothetical protein